MGKATKPPGAAAAGQGTAGPALRRRAGGAAGAKGAAAPRSPGRPPLMADPRQHILDHAARLFAQKGYAASSLNDLSAGMNYSKGAIYNYFSSKQEIYDAIIIATLGGLHRAAADAVRPDDPPAQQLRAFMIAHAQFLGDHYDSFVTMLVSFSGMADAPLKADALALRQAHEGLLRRILADGIASGAFRPVDPAMAGRAVLSLLSWMVRWFDPAGPKSAREVAQDYYDMLVGGLAAPAGGGRSR